MRVLGGARGSDRRAFNSANACASTSSAGAEIFFFTTAIFFWQGESGFVFEVTPLAALLRAGIPYLVLWVFESGVRV